MLKRLKIVLGEVDSRQTKIIDADTGEELTNVRAIRIEAGVDRATTVSLDLVGVEVWGDVSGQIVADVTTIGQAEGWVRHKAV